MWPAITDRASRELWMRKTRTSDFHLFSLATLPENSVNKIPRLSSQGYNMLSRTLRTSERSKLKLWWFPMKYLINYFLEQNWSWKQLSWFKKKKKLLVSGLDWYKNPKLWCPLHWPYNLNVSAYMSMYSIHVYFCFGFDSGHHHIAQAILEFMIPCLNFSSTGMDRYRFHIVMHYA